MQYQEPALHRCPPHQWIYVRKIMFDADGDQLEGVLVQCPNCYEVRELLGKERE